MFYIKCEYEGKYFAGRDCCGNDIFTYKPTLAEQYDNYEDAENVIEYFYLAGVAIVEEK